MFLERLLSGRKKGETAKTAPSKPGAIYADRWDRSAQKPVIRSSICTGEKVAGFKSLATGKFEDIMLIRDEKDMKEFLRLYGVNPEEVTKEW